MQSSNPVPADTGQLTTRQWLALINDKVDPALVEAFAGHVATRVFDDDTTTIWAAVSPLLKMEKYTRGVLLVALALLMHAGNDLVRRAMFDAIRGVDENVDLRVKIVDGLCQGGRDMRHVEHALVPLLVRWLAPNSGDSITGDNDSKLICGSNTASVINLATRLVKCAFLHLDRDDVAALTSRICNIASAAEFLAYMDALVRYGQIPASCVEECTKRLVSQCATVPAAKSVMQHLVASHFGAQVFHAVCLHATDADMEIMAGAVVCLADIESRATAYQWFSYRQATESYISALERKNLKVTQQVLNALVCRTGTQVSQLDMWVDILLNTLWITSITAAENETSFGELQAQLIAKICNEYPHMSWPAQRGFIKGLMHVDKLAIPAAELFLEECVAVLSLDSGIQQSDIVKVFEMFYIAPYPPNLRVHALQVVEALQSRESLETIVKLVSRSLLVEHDSTCFTDALRILIKYAGKLDTDTFKLVLEHLVCIVLNVCAADGYSLEMFWNEAAVRDPQVPDPAQSLGFKSAEHGTTARVAAADMLPLLFHSVGSKIDRGEAVYTWICRMFAWTRAVPVQVRSSCAKFLVGVSADPRGHIQYSVADTKRLSHVWGTNNALYSAKARLPVARYAALLIVHLEFEASFQQLQDTLKGLDIQIQDHSFWQGAFSELEIIRQYICKAILRESAAHHVQNLPATVRKSDVYLWYYRILVSLISYKSTFSRASQDEMIVALQFGLGRWPSSTKLCMEGLTLSLYELPMSIIKHLPSLLMKISQMTSMTMSVCNLEFLSALARNPDLFVNFTEADYKRILGIALQYLRAESVPAVRTVATQYVAQLGYQVVSLWFLAIRLTERKKYVGFVLHHLTGSSKAEQLSALPEPVELVIDLVVNFDLDDSEHFCRLFTETG